jgi:hypothetical protein
MKTIKLSPAKLAQRRRRKKMLLWQGEQLKRFKLFRLARVKR